MKKQLILSVLFTLSTVLIGYSQDQKMFGGLDFIFNSHKTKLDTNSTKSSIFGIRPTFGYWLNNRSAIVIGVSFGTAKFADIKSNTLGFNLNYRTGWNVSDNVFVYLSPGVAFSSSTSDIDTPIEEKSTEFEVGISPGIQYKFANKWSFVTEFGNLGYSSEKIKDGETHTNFGLNLGMSSLNFGLQYHF